MNKEEGKILIKDKVKDFELNKYILTKKGFGETNIRTNYIDVLFESLGWDMKDYRDVKREYTQKDTSGTKKVDYAFKSKGKLKFFVEAKEASVDLVNDRDAIYQAKRYSYSTNGKAPIVILTDFEEFRVFNVLKAPIPENPNRELLKTYSMKYSDYENNWEILWNTFSKEAVDNGSLDILRGKIDKNTKLMDEEFLEQIMEWRKILAENIHLRNKSLSINDLNSSVQRILDRLLFIRNLEDREIEPENTLLDLVNTKKGVYNALLPVLAKLDKVYNGLLFKKHISESLHIDDSVLNKIIKAINYPISPFQFDVIEPEILGRIYEKFLGSKIVLGKYNQVVVKEKMEVRKAGGVYYTPEYIVNYIVENTVGKKIIGLSPEQITKLKILDPACGSGSFLLGAYSCLLNYHEKWYNEHRSDKTYKRDYYFSSQGEIKISLIKRGEILKNNLFGVDIDHEATEVAIMSLYLKMMDYGFDKGQRDLFFEKGQVLPSMSENIKCGNSLINTDFYDTNTTGLFESDKLLDIKAFNWSNNFNDIFNSGGFDCVIGNPPYITYSLGKKQKDNKSIDIEYLQSKWVNSCDYKINSFALFYELATTIINRKGYAAFIVPGTILINESLSKIRSYLIKSNILKSYHKLDYKIFVGAEMGDCAILFLDKTHKLECINSFYSNSVDNILTPLSFNIKRKDVLNTQDCRLLKAPADYQLIQKREDFLPLGDLCKLYNGIKTGNNKKFIAERKINNKYLPIVRGKDFYRYSPINIKAFVYFDPRKLWSNCNEDILSIKPKILIRQTGDTITATYDKKGIYPMDTVHMIYESEIDFYILLGLINSETFNNLHRSLVPEEGKAFAEVKIANLKKINIPKPQILNSQTELKKLVIKIIELNKVYHKAKNDTEKTILYDQIDNINNKINYIIVGLYS